MSESLPAARLAEAYEVQEVVRRGSLSTTYRVRHRGTGDLRCIDVLRPAPGEREALERRLDADARPLMEMRHPNLVRLVDAAVGEDGRACLVREDHEGVTLRRLTGSRLASVPLAVELMRQAADAMAFLHEKGRKVGNLSPEGLLVGRGPDGGPCLVIADLGLAKDWQEEASLTAAGLFIGQLRYKAPEQFDTAGRRGEAGDVYALGLVAYEMLTGKHPIEGDSVSSLIAGHLFRPPMDFAASDPESRVPDGLREVVLSALAKEVSQRPKASALRDRLAELQDTIGSVDPRELDRWVDPQVPGRPAAPDEAQLVAWLEEAHALARDEEFLEAREKVRKVLKVQPDHSMALMLLASLEACLKIQVEESKAHQTLVVGQGAGDSASEAETVLRPGRRTVQLSTLGGDSDSTPGSDSDPDPDADATRQTLGTETVRVTADELQKMAAAGGTSGAQVDEEMATQRLEGVSQMPGGPGSTERLDLGRDPSTVIKADLDDDKTRPLSPDLLQQVAEKPPADLADGTTQLLDAGHGGRPSREELPGTVTMPMEVIEEQKRRALQEQASATSESAEAEQSDGDGSEAQPSLSTLPAIPQQPAPAASTPTPTPRPTSSTPAASSPPSPPSTPPSPPAPDSEHPASFAEPTPTPSREPSADLPPAEPAPQAPPQPAAPGPAADAPASVDDLGFGGAPAPSFTERAPRGRSRKKGKGRRSRRGSPERRGGGTVVMIGAAVAAVLVFAIGYSIAADVDLRQLVGLGEAENIVPPSELPPVAADPGWLILDAAPWAEIVQIVDSMGEEVSLRFRHTPARYELPPGSYSVLISAPEADENQTLELEVVSGQATEARPEMVELDVDDYFRFMEW